MKPLSRIPHPLSGAGPSLPSIVRTCACVLALCFVTACGRWVEVPPLLIGCGDIEEMKDDVADPDKFSIVRGMLDGVCGQSGGKFAGGLRCEKEHVQVQCK